MFQWGRLTGVTGVKKLGIVRAPIFMIGAVFGPTMHYQVFLVSRMARSACAVPCRGTP
ncbi:hypothetical protein Acsp04_22180 [Actinomadura sp. NBRC 104425]|nr:hypothetical protein Acsp04_22180 [Actinomadura sp. NBRC 104425]